MKWIAFDGWGGSGDDDWLHRGNFWFNELLKQSERFRAIDFDIRNRVAVMRTQIIPRFKHGTKEWREGGVLSRFIFQFAR